ncbi:hypothetical protein [Paludisphaera mucosa]|uniref:Uncharacterized protein n=1 Tax=Paludisphaera mucosa TaxID=3030827 RepID=A0ABT6FKV5_9BACT|nr:hypothetical protein [Paludisphaera mucosa]MDG3008177.1 hypothetical protein [Paludisphaera mucosa]
MTTHIAAHRKASWLDGLKSTIAGLFTRPERKPCPPGTALKSSDCVPITTDEAVDLASEDSFPASDPPSYTGMSAN